MSIRPSKGIDQSWYSQSKTLDRNAASDFPSLVQRIQRFDRDSMILMVSGCEWHAWSLSPDDPKLKTDLNYIFTRYSIFIGTLALIFCEEKKENLVDEVDLRILVGELFNIGGFEPGSDWFTDHEVTPLKSRLKELNQENHYLRKIDPNDTKVLSSLLLMSRTALIQWDGLSFSAADWIRSLLLYEKYRQIALLRNFCNTEELDQAENQFLGTTCDHLMRGVMVLIALFKASISDPSKPPGAFDPKTASLPEELESKLKVKNDDLEVIVDRFAIKTSSLRKGDVGFKKIPAKAWLCSKDLWTLHDHPLVRIDDKAPGSLVLSVSPQRLMPKCARIFQNDIVQFYEANNVFKAKQRAFDLRGAALEEYIAEVTNGTSIQRVECLVPKDYRGKRPDFLWVGSDWTILFEVKANVKMNSDLTFFNSASLIDSWKILTEPIDQGREFIGNGMVKTKRCCLVIVTNDNLSEPMTNFKRVAKNWNFLEDTRIDSLGILSLSQFEAAVTHHSPDAVGKNLQATWDALDPLSVHSTLLDYNFFDAHRLQKNPPAHIEKKWNELFPSIKMGSF